MESQAVATVHIDNDRATVTEWSIPPGVATGLHLHSRDYVVVPQTSGTLELTEQRGDTRRAELTAGQPYFRNAGVEHNVKNAGDATIVFIEIEIE